MGVVTTVYPPLYSSKNKDLYVYLLLRALFGDLPISKDIMTSIVVILQSKLDNF